MKMVACWVLALFVGIQVFAQESSVVYQRSSVNRDVRTFKDTADLSSPLSAFVASMYNQADGKGSHFCEIATEAFRSSSGADYEVDPERREMLLNRKIYEVIQYRDSVAGVISSYDDKGEYLVGYVNLEQGRWVNSGENPYPSIEKARAGIESYLPRQLDQVRRIARLHETPASTTPFVNYLHRSGQEPREFLLDALGSHKIVIFGEQHLQKESWTFLKEVIRDKRFARTTGTVFLEQSVVFQDKLDRFFSGQKMETGLLLDILRDNAFWGWEDRRLYEFLIELWKANRKLPADQRVRVVATDAPEASQELLWSEIRNEEDYMETVRRYNRDEYMFQTIDSVLSGQHEKRGNLFVVGVNHTQKMAGKGKTATLLTRRFSPEALFSVMVHTAVSDNKGDCYGLLRNGVFDEAFEMAGNDPVAFPLYGSPFGVEPFDRNEEVRAYPSSGNYADNYDGYIFLKPLGKRREYRLYGLYTDDYIAELKRRAYLLDTDVVRSIPVDSLSADLMISRLKLWEKQGKKKSSNIISR